MVSHQAEEMDQAVKTLNALLKQRQKPASIMLGKIGHPGRRYRMQENMIDTI